MVLRGPVGQPLPEVLPDPVPPALPVVPVVPVVQLHPEVLPGPALPVAPVAQLHPEVLPGPALPEALVAQLHLEALPDPVLPAALRDPQVREYRLPSRAHRVRSAAGWRRLWCSFHHPQDRF